MSGNSFVSEVQISGRSNRTVLPAARHRSNISLKAVLPRRNDAEKDPANSLHALRRNAALIWKLDWLC